MSAQRSLGWVGAGGRMGFAMAKRLLAAGHSVAVYNRTRSKVEPLGELGAKIVDTPRDLRGCDIVFTTVSASDDLIAVCTGPDGGPGPAAKSLRCCIGGPCCVCGVAPRDLPDCAAIAWIQHIPGGVGRMPGPINQVVC